MYHNESVFNHTGLVIAVSGNSYNSINNSGETTTIMPLGPPQSRV